MSTAGDIVLTDRLSMLRSATALDPEQDLGLHRFSFAITPNVGRMLESGVSLDALRCTNDVGGQAGGTLRM